MITYLIICLLFANSLNRQCKYYLKFSKKSSLLTFVYSPILIPYIIGLYILSKFKINKIKNKSLFPACKYIETYIYGSTNLTRQILNFLELDFFFPKSMKYSKNIINIFYIFHLIKLTSDSTSGWKYNLINTWKNIKMIFPTNLWANYVGQSFITAINGKLLDYDWCRIIENGKTVYYSYDVCFGRLRIYKTIYNDGDNLFLKTIENMCSKNAEEISEIKEVIYNKFIFTKNDALKSLEYFQSMDMFEYISFSKYTYNLKQLKELKSNYSREKLLEIIYYFLRDSNDLCKSTKDCLNTLVWKSEDEKDVSKLEEYINEIMLNEKNHYDEFYLKFYNTYWKDVLNEWIY